VKPVWFAAAAALAVLLVLRRRRFEPTLLVMGAIAVVAMAVYGTGVIHLPNLDKALEDVGGALGKWTYLLVGVLAFAETGAFIGLIAPGETTIIVGGVVAGQGEIDLIVLIALVWTCAVAGDLTSFALGRRLGRDFLVRNGPKVQISVERIEQVEGFFNRHGGKAVLIGRFVGLVRAVAPFLAGSSGMPLRRFVPYDVVGAGLWGATFCVLGYVFWRSIDQVISIAKKGSLALATVIVLVTAIVWAVRWLRDEDNRRRARDRLAQQERKPVIGPVVRTLLPVARRGKRPARFVWNRVTPGDLGLELTTLLAVAGVGLFVFVGYAIGLDGNEHTPGDLRGLHWADDLRTGWLDDVSKAVTHLGTLPVAGGVLVLVALGLFAAREVLEGVALLSGLVVTYAGVHIAKNALDRPRPPRSLVETDGSAYPSGHAAYAMAWVAIAVALRRAVPGMGPRAAVLAAGIAIAVAVGLTRIELRAHWFSDVAGGWGLGAGAFAVCGMGMLVVAHLRHNERSA
jgi:undecaprenyl-diphosphatase